MGQIGLTSDPTVAFQVGQMGHVDTVKVERAKPPKKPNEEGVARDFHDMPTYNRHKNDKVSKMYPPSSALHLSNMPDNTSPDEVLAVLRAAGAQVRNFKFLDNLNHIAVVLCTSLDNAVKVI